MKLTLNIADYKVLALEFFFIFSLFFFTYASNIYIAWGFLTFSSLLISSKYQFQLPIIILLTLIALIPLYSIQGGFEGGFRVLKSTVIILSLILISTCTSTPNKGFTRLLRPLHIFMTASAALVCVDFVLFFTIGHTITDFTSSGFMPRPKGFMEDSNFFSYSMLCYIMYLKFASKKSTKLLIISLFCSGSMSAIIMLICMLFLYKRIKISDIKIDSSRWRRWRVFIISTVILFHGCYYVVVSNKDEIIQYIKEQDLPPFLKIKAISMFMRFDAQKLALDAIASNNDQILGGGPGITRTLNERAMNLHNTYYQIYVEMGLILLSIISITLFYFMTKIRLISYLFLFGMMTLFGNMLEIFYSPILPLIYFLYQITYITDGADKQLSVNSSGHLPK